MNKSGTCDTCHKVSEAPNNFVESKHFLQCPECGNLCYLMRKSINEMIKEAGLRKEDLTGKKCEIVLQSKIKT